MILLAREKISANILAYLSNISLLVSLFVTILRSYSLYVSLNMRGEERDLTRQGRPLYLGLQIFT